MAYSICLNKDRFKFSATHFTVFSKDRGEALHGHNYQVTLNIDFQDVHPETGLAIEFSKLKDILKNFCDILDEKVLLPGKSSFINIRENQNNIEIQFKDRFYSFPKEDCKILDITNTSSECLAFWLHKNLKTSLENFGAKKFSVTLQETQGQSVTFHSPCFNQ